MEYQDFPIIPVDQKFILCFVSKLSFWILAHDSYFTIHNEHEAA